MKVNAKIDLASEAPILEFLDVLNSTMTPFLAKIGFSWDVNWKPVYDALLESNAITGQDQFYIQLNRLMMNITVKVFEVHPSFSSAEKLGAYAVVELR